MVNRTRARMVGKPIADKESVMSTMDRKLGLAKIDQVRKAEALNKGTKNGKSKTLLAREAKEEASVARFKATASKVMDVLNKPVVNGKAKVTEKAPVKAKDDRQTQRLVFIKANTQTILKAWADLKGKKSGAALNRVLPKTWSCKWIDEVLMLAGLRQSGEKVVIDAVQADKSFLKDVVATQAKGKGTIETKKTHAIPAPVVKNGGYTDEG